MAKVKHFGRLAFRNSWNNLLLFNDAGLERISLTIYVYQKNSESSFETNIPTNLLPNRSKYPAIK